MVSWSINDSFLSNKINQHVLWRFRHTQSWFEETNDWFHPFHSCRSEGRYPDIAERETTDSPKYHVRIEIDSRNYEPTTIRDIQMKICSLLFIIWNSLESNLEPRETTLHHAFRKALSKYTD